MHLRWIDEFARILRPGDILIATTRERDFINRCHLTAILTFTERPLACPLRPR